VRDLGQRLKRHGERLKTEGRDWGWVGERQGRGKERLRPRVRPRGETKGRDQGKEANECLYISPPFTNSSLSLSLSLSLANRPLPDETRYRVFPVPVGWRLQRGHRPARPPPRVLAHRPSEHRVLRVSLFRCLSGQWDLLGWIQWDSVFGLSPRVMRCITTLVPWFHPWSG